MRFSSSWTPPSVSNRAWLFVTVTVIGRVMLESASMQLSRLPGATANVNTVTELGSIGPDVTGVGVLPVWVQPAINAAAANAATALVSSMIFGPPCVGHHTSLALRGVYLVR